jgi:hypothetical protein
MYLQTVICGKTLKKNLFCVGVLKVNDENSRIRIRIHIKMSWIRYTASNIHSYSPPTSVGSAIIYSGSYFLSRSGSGSDP